MCTLITGDGARVCPWAFFCMIHARSPGWPQTDNDPPASTPVQVSEHAPLYLAQERSLTELNASMRLAGM